jgi:Na+/H+ antiporter NhaD/arsenite permease-like protein
MESVLMSGLGMGKRIVGLGLFLAFLPAHAFAADGLALAGIPPDFVLFGVTLLGVALFHNRTLEVALTGLVAIVLYKLGFTGFSDGRGFVGLGRHFSHEAIALINLLLLLLGFSLLARHFEKTRIPAVLPAILPHGWKGGFALLVMVFLLSGFLDNIAAALIGGAMAHQLFRARVHVAYLVAIVAAANAGGAGSVLGDTTTTMMWIDGVNPADVLHAYIPAGVALCVFGIPAAIQQQRHSPIIGHAHGHTHVDWLRVGVVGLILGAALAANLASNLAFPGLSDSVPVLGLAVWGAILVTAGLRRPDWEILPETFKSALFLICLVSCASLMPVASLPTASWHSAFGLGFVSSVFDNIPLTALALRQGGYDWGGLAYAVGFGGSMLWFGSSAGVALSNQFPEAKSVSLWLRHGWYVIVAYVIGFAVLLAAVGWQPHPPHKPATQVAPEPAQLPAHH